MNKTTLEKLLSKRLSLHAIAKRQGCSIGRVRYWMKKYALQCLPAQRPQYVHDETAFRKAVADCHSIAHVLRRLDRAAVGSNYRFVKKEITRLQLSTAHWREKYLASNVAVVPLEVVLVRNSTRLITCRYKKRILELGVLQNTCAVCGAVPVWNGKPLVMILDHINGVRNDNRVENLRMVCPNCNSQLPTFCGRNKQRKV